jgi:hypothetical protein
MNTVNSICSHIQQKINITNRNMHWHLSEDGDYRLQQFVVTKMARKMQKVKAVLQDKLPNTLQLHIINFVSKYILCTCSFTHDLLNLSHLAFG